MEDVSAQHTNTMAEMIRPFPVGQIQSLRKRDNPKLVKVAKYAVYALNAQISQFYTHKKI